MRRGKICEIFSDIPTLKTERLTLREMRVTDAEDMFSYASGQKVTEYLLWSPHPTRSYTEEYLRYIKNRYSLGEFYDWAIIENISGKMIGTCGFTRFEFAHDCGEIGYVLNPEYHGNGYGTEAARRVMSFGFDVLGLHRIEAKFMKGNDASLHVMEKLGMKFEGYRRDAMLVKGKYRTIGVSAILRDEFMNNKF